MHATSPGEKRTKGAAKGVKLPCFSMHLQWNVRLATKTKKGGVPLFCVYLELHVGFTGCFGAVKAVFCALFARFPLTFLPIRDGSKEGREYTGVRTLKLQYTPAMGNCTQRERETYALS